MIIQEIRDSYDGSTGRSVAIALRQVRRDGVAVQVAPEEVVLDDIIELRPGDQIVVDGETVESRGARRRRIPAYR